MVAGVHASIRPEWLELVQEDLLVPGIPVIDAHHHFWNRPGNRYLAEQFAQDLQSVPQIAGSVFVQCRSGYWANGPEHLRPVGEVEYVREVSSKLTELSDGKREVLAIVAGADLRRGSGVASVLDAMEEAGGGLLRGIRNQTAWHADPDVVSSPFPPAADVLSNQSFQAGAAELGLRGLTLDVWAYHTQLEQVAALADACPGTTIIVDHFGGPIGIGPYADAVQEVRVQWQRSIRELSKRPNVRIKLSGVGLKVFGNGFDNEPAPPDSKTLAGVMRPMADWILEHFGAERCMFASNFPVDKGMFSYRTLWNAFSRLSSGLDIEDQHRLFHGTAEETYRIAKTH